ncbi:pilus assembly protein PilM [Coleofasciculus sp. FACHB-64]|nr:MULTISPECIES: type IV pilus biogenesis protein PilM [unclassified Coleofasciculus]MBD1839347.1 pilus assembly protein PilM [Coleofasciculus sp. FACHB-501]MBD1877984.1 pilus assembly protein PilM [Coleofasciculus sp. FACHB-T130]MBD1888715.1 pilus assembly protein PilM [Coleofasciculus sp. FACHB-SPT9]MBD1896481.1 pilus assembly protein PilM [Coleofasciculus sp. FACHB-129]MBD1901774.1 pilus assembly protein PilM [Coleofasciculus sp. FACHB-125]
MFTRFKGLLSKRTKGIGIEIAPERINIAQLRKQGQGFKLTMLSSKEVPEGVFQEGKIIDAPALAELIKEAIAESKIKVQNVATAVSGREAVVRVIPVPAELDDKELREMVLDHEAGLYLPFPREEADVDYQKLGFFTDEDGIEKVQVLLVATRKDVTDTYIETFREAGLKIDVLEISSFSLIRTIREQLRQFGPQEAAVLVDIEFDSTEIAIIVDGVPQFSRTVPIGTYQLQSALNRAMNLPTSRNTEILQGMTIPNTPVDNVRTGATGINPGMAALVRVLGELADELRRSIDFYLNQSENLEVAQLLLAGPGGGIGQLDEFFTQRLSLPTTQVDPVAALSLEVIEEISPVQRPGLGVVLGLGLREV